eukprot:6775935-Prymnesium_polylepis.1
MCIRDSPQPTPQPQAHVPIRLLPARQSASCAPTRRASSPASRCPSTGASTSRDDRARRPRVTAARDHRT